MHRSPTGCVATTPTYLGSSARTRVADGAWTTYESSHPLSTDRRPTAVRRVPCRRPRAATRPRPLPEARTPRSLEDIVGADDVVVPHALPRPLCARVRGHMDDRVHPVERGRDGVVVRDVRDDEIVGRLLIGHGMVILEAQVIAL